MSEEELIKLWFESEKENEMNNFLVTSAHYEQMKEYLKEFLLFYEEASNRTKF